MCHTMNKQLKKLALWVGVLMISISQCSFGSMKHITYDNGLTVYLIHDPTASIVSVRTFVNVGSATEKNYLGTGISHYLEHVVAGGSTTSRTEKTYKHLISLFGGAFNAYTSPDHTSYFINTTPEHVNDAISVLHEWMFHCALNPKEVKREKGVILKEIEKNNANLKRQFYQQNQENFYKFHSLKYPVIGYEPHFKTLKRDDLMAFYRLHYVPSNMVLVVGGNLDIPNASAHIKDTFGKVPFHKAPLHQSFPEPIPIVPRKSDSEGKTNVTYLSIRFPTVELSHPDLYPLDLLEYILANGEESLLYKTLVEEKKLAYSVSCLSYTPTITTGYFDIRASIDKHHQDAVFEEIKRIIDGIKRGNIQQQRLARAKKQKLAEDIFSIETIEDKVSRVGESHLASYTPHFFESYISHLRDVDKNDISRAANKYFQFDRYTLTTLSPQTTPTESSEPQAVSTDRVLPEKITLPNGINILLYQDTALPRTFAKICVLGGIRGETKLNNGIGHLTAMLLGSGSERYSKSTIKQTIEDNGASMDGALGRNTLYYSLDCLGEDFDDLFSLFTHTFLKPKFLKKELDEVKRRTLQSIKQRRDDWQRYSSYRFKQLFYQDHPYSLSQIGEAESISKLTVTDIDAYAKTLQNPKQLVISVFGDFDKDVVISKIKQSFSSLQPLEAKKSLDRKSHNTKTMTQIPIDQDVAAIFIAFDGVTFQDKTDHIKLDLLDSVLSGMNYPGGRLHSLLRGEELVYMVHAYHMAGLENGHFIIYALTDRKNVDKAKNLIFSEINSLQTRLISQDEFQTGLSQLSFYYKDRHSSLESLSLISAIDELYGLGFDYYHQAETRLSTLVPQDVKDMASTYLVNPQIYIFEGPASALKKK